MKKLLLIILLIINTNLFSQVKKQIDSLEILLKNTKKDVVKIKIIEQLGELTYDSDSVKFNYYKKQLKKLSYKLKSDLGFVKLYIFEGADHYIHGRTNKSILSFKKALFFSKKAKSDVAMATCYNNIAGMESVNSNYKIAISNYMESLKIHEKRKDLKEQFSSLRSIIDLYIVLEDFTNVEKYIHKALPLLPNSKKDISATFRFYQNLGTFYRFKGNYELSIEYLKKSINLVKVNYQGLNENQNGFAYVEMALTYLKVKDYKNAKLYLDKCSIISKQDPGFSLVSDYNQTLTQYYLETKDFQKAKEANSIARINFEKFSNEKGVLVSYQNGEKIAIAQKNYWQAYLNKVEAEKIEKKISSREIKLAIAEIDIKYESLKKEKLLAINKSEAKIRNILLIFTTILILLLIFS